VHDEPGPHGGQIIEIGAKDHHAEFVQDEQSHKVGVYVLDGDAITSTPIESKSVVIDITRDGETTKYELPALPQSGEPDDTSSYFEIADEGLSKILSGESDAENIRAELRIQIGEGPFVGFINIGDDVHEHDGHDHDKKPAEGNL
jgi:hypothetical protein